ncbi:MAG: hypothetical protein J2P16_10715, partial [Mycobacterium sp.]|nr:hypothetical protein [Mycobacterium sp.]
AGTRGIAAKTITVPLRVKKANLTTFAVKVSPAKIIAKTTRAVLTVTLAAPANTGHGLVTVKRAGRARAKARVGGTRKIPLPAFAAAGKKVVKLVFAGNAVVKGKTISHTIRVVKG